MLIFDTIIFFLFIIYAHSSRFYLLKRELDQLERQLKNTLKALSLNPDYALENLLRAETSSKQNALPLFLLHHSGYYASVKKVSVLLSFQLSLRFLMHNLG